MHRNGATNGCSNKDIIEVTFDANGDPIKVYDGMKIENSSDEEAASSSSIGSDETDEFIELKTRY